MRDAVLFGARNRGGWGIGLTILTALAKLIPCLPEEETYLALYKGMSRVARDCDGAFPRRDRQPLAPRQFQPLPLLERWFRHWTRVRHRDAAERTLLTAIASGASSIELAALMLIAVTDRTNGRPGAEQPIIRFSEPSAHFPAHVHLDQRELLEILRVDLVEVGG